MSAEDSQAPRKPRLDPNSPTPRVDLAERHFYSAGAEPQGYVMSDLARQLELELAQALQLLKDKGIELPAQAAPGSEPAQS